MSNYFFGTRKITNECYCCVYIEFVNFSFCCQCYHCPNIISNMIKSIHHSILSFAYKRATSVENFHLHFGYSDMNFKILILCALLCVFESQSQAEQAFQPYIINGVRSPVAPYFAYIQFFQGNNNAWGGGALVSAQHIVTSASIVAP
jgi:hypothetical protein